MYSPVTFTVNGVGTINATPDSYDIGGNTTTTHTATFSNLTCATNYTYSMSYGGSGQPGGQFATTACVSASSVPVPTLSEWAHYMMAFMLLLAGGWYLRRAKGGS
jgi:hypothetical protein